MVTFTNVTLFLTCLHCFRIIERRSCSIRSILLLISIVFSGLEHGQQLYCFSSVYFSKSYNSSFNGIFFCNKMETPEKTNKTPTKLPKRPRKRRYAKHETIAEKSLPYFDQTTERLENAQTWPNM